MKRRLLGVAALAIAMAVPVLVAGKGSGIGELLGLENGAGAGAANGDVAGSSLDIVENLLFALVKLVGAIATGAVLAFHPRHRSRVASLEEIDIPKIFITYTLVGAFIAFLVGVNNAMALAIFGAGGLMRFRTILPSAKDTGRLILATLIGFCWGIGLFEMAVAGTVLAWLLIFLLDVRVGYRMMVKGLEADTLAESADAYLDVLRATGCRISQVKKNLNKGQLSVVFLGNRQTDREELEDAFRNEIDESLQGTVDWPEEN